MARARDQGYLLHGAANRNAKPGVVGVRHVCANETPRDFSLTRVTPRDTPRTDVGAELDEALAGEVIEIEL